VLDAGGVWAGGLLIVFARYITTQQKLEKANTDLEHANGVARQLVDQLVKQERNQIKVKT